MRGQLACCFVATLAASTAADEASYIFTTGLYEIEMLVEFPPRYSGRRLVFYDSTSGKEICFAADGNSGGCLERFVGAVAVVRYSVRHRTGGTPANAAIREYVTVIAQSPGLPERPPFAKKQRLVDGSASDIQVFGYDESPLSRPDRGQAREKAGPMVFRSYRQELFLNEDSIPFATIEWKHSLDRITIARVDAPVRKP